VHVSHPKNVYLRCRTLSLRVLSLIWVLDPTLEISSALQKSQTKMW